MNTIGSIFSTAGTLASIFTIVAELSKWRLKEARPRVRLAVAVGLLVSSVALGIVSLRPGEPPAQQRGVPIISATPSRQGFEMTVTGDIGDATPPSKPKPTTPQKRQPKAEADSEITIADAVREIPEAVAAADEALLILRSDAHLVRGTLRGSQSEPDVALAGIITTNLTLDVKLIGRDGVPFEAFTITSRGGGFTRNDSGLQARERLCVALRERIGKVSS